MANACYFHRLLDIIRSPLGHPLLLQLSADTDKLCALLSTVLDRNNAQVTIVFEQALLPARALSRTSAQ